jgi:CRP/FNR family transcriptional regulator
MLDISRQYAQLINGKQVECESCGINGLCLLGTLSRHSQNKHEKLAFTRRHIEAGEELYYASRMQANLYIVVTGTIKTVIEGYDGSQQITGFCLTGDILALDSIGDRSTNSSAVATEFSTVCEIPKSRLDELCSQNNTLMRLLMNALGNKIIRQQQHMMILGQMAADARVAKFLVDTSNHFKNLGYSASEFNIHIARHDIANYLSLAPETLSRVMKKLSAIGFVEIKARNIKIRNMTGLQKLSGISSYSRRF